VGRPEPSSLANITTFGVQDMARERLFYSELEWPIVFELGGALLALFPLDKLAADSRAQPELRRGGIRSSIIAAPERVDELADRVARAGGALTKPPTDAEFFSGRDAYFRRPRRQLPGGRPRTGRQSCSHGGASSGEPAVVATTGFVTRCAGT
jgi:hypothetical protein